MVFPSVRPETAQVREAIGFDGCLRYLRPGGRTGRPPISLEMRRAEPRPRFSCGPSSGLGRESQDRANAGLYPPTRAWLVAVLAAPPADGAGRSAHHHAFRRDDVLAPFDAVQQRPVGDSGRGEDDVALGEVVEVVDAVQV